MVERNNVPEMGIPTDMKTRRSNVRINDQSRKKKVSQARKYIFKHGASANGVRVKRLLADKSLVPTEVHFRHENIQTY